MPFADLSPQQQQFVNRYLKHGMFSKKSNARKVEHFELFLQLEQDFTALYAQVPAGTPGRDAANAQRDAAVAAKDSGQFKKAHTGINKALADLRAVDDDLTARRQMLLNQLNNMVMRPGAAPNDVTFFNNAVQAGIAALAAQRPTPAQFATANAELHKALTISARTEDLRALARRFPAAAAAAQTSFENMRAITGGGVVTDERIAAAGQSQIEAAAEFQRLQAEQQRIQRLGVTSQADIAANDALLTQVEQDLAAAQQALTDARNLEKALKGTRLLEAALEDGPLSGNSAARRMPDRAVEALIAGFEVDPDLASKTVAIANDALDPLAVANAIPGISAQIQNGFADQNGDTLDGLNAEAYALTLLETGGTCGGDYFARLDDYVRLGGLVAANPLRENVHDSKDAKVQKRAVGAAEGLVDPATGQLDLTSDRAKLAVGQTLFHPVATGAHGAPAHSKHVLETLAFLSNAANAQSANNILTGITFPPVGGGQRLVMDSLGQATPADENDARVAVVAAMLQSVDQGEIGSCFATGPVRQMRALDPIEAMTQYSDLATDGTLTDANGNMIPAITNLPPDEDPLIRSLEYTLATAVGRETTMILQTDLRYGVERATTYFMLDMIPHVGAATADDIANDLEDAINNEFTPTYDPTIEFGTTSADGSSDRGAYVLRDSAGNLIRTRDDYLDRVEALALNEAGYPAGSAEEQAVVDAVRGPLAERLDRMRHKPWELPRGGYSKDARTALHGTANVNRFVEPADAPTSAEEYGARTAELLGGLMDNHGTTPDNLVQLDVSGIHTMNFTQNDPSFVALMAEPGATAADKIASAISGPGATFAVADLNEADAQAIYDKIINPALEHFEGQANDDTATSKQRSKAKAKLKTLKKRIKKFRPTEPMVPREVSMRAGETMKGIGNDRHAREAVRNEMAQKFSDPQVVIADTNWGTGAGHVYYVIAADPLTGEPFMWERTDPPGKMSRVKSEWLTKQWMLMT